MSLETASYIHQLNPSNPSGADRLKDGDDHIRMIKAALKATFPGIAGPLSSSVTHTLLNSFAAYLVPKGSIVLWTGAENTVPAGWTVCDGRQAQWADGSATFTTPNFSDRAGVGASGARPVGTAFGQASKTATTTVDGSHAHSASTGAAGSHSHSGATALHALTIAQMPSHDHGNGMGDNSTGMFVYGSKAGSTPSQNLQSNDGAGTFQGLTETIGGGQGHSHGITADGAHTHPVYVDASGAHGHNVTLDVTQPSLSVYYIMKL